MALETARATNEGERNDDDEDTDDGATECWGDARKEDDGMDDDDDDGEEVEASTAAANEVLEALEDSAPEGSPSAAIVACGRCALTSGVKSAAASSRAVLGEVEKELAILLGMGKSPPPPAGAWKGVF